MKTSNEELKALKEAISLVFARHKHGGPFTEEEVKLVAILEAMVNVVHHDEMTFRQLQAEQREWVNYNFGDQPTYRPFLGMVEEIGELAHALLKGEVGIRGSAAKHEAKAKDAIADLIIYTAGLCNRSGWDLQAIIEEVWPQVQSRDWKKWPNSGHPEETCPACQGNNELSHGDLGYVHCSLCNDNGWIPEVNEFRKAIDETPVKTTCENCGGDCDGPSGCNN